jgi:hypothetical protein
MNLLIGRLTARPSVPGGMALVIASGWVLITNWDPVVHGHPSYLAFYIGLLAAGAGVVVGGLIRPAPSRRGWSVAAAAGLFLLSFGAIWLSPFEAERRAIAALEDPDGLRVVESWTSILLEPESTEPELGVVFFPGARVDSRAYSRMLIPIAEAGFEVVIVKEPLGIAFLSFGFATSWIESHPDVSSWVMGGHSLGGVAAASQAVDQAATGLVLWASYPAGDISDATSLQVASVYGTNDGLTLPERVEASAVDLPASASLFEVAGAVHSHFGDYGAQPGDGQPSVDREIAQTQIVGATLGFLEDLAGFDR